MTEDKCEYYDNGKCDNFDLVNYNCDDSNNCAWYQLKRLEQDSKQLTQWLDEARRNADFWCDKCTSLEQENKELGRKAFLAEQNVRTTASTFCEKDNKIKELEQENKQMKSQRDEARIAYNNLILDIVSDIPFTGEIGGERNISIKDHLHQMQKALASLEEIKHILEIHKDELEECLHNDIDGMIQNKINEVLNDI